MIRVWLSSLAACAVLSLASVALGQDDTFTLGWEGDTRLSGNPGDVVSGSCLATLTHDAPNDEAGAQGWSISMTIQGDGSPAITGVGIVGTDAEALFSGGFEKSETTPPDRSVGECEGLAGAVSAVVLSFTMPIVVPPNSTASIAAVTFEATIGEEDGAVTLSYVNGCRGSGQPVNNNITQEGATRIPELQEKTVELKVVRCGCTAPLGLGFSSSVVSSDTAWDGVAGVDASNLCPDGGDLCEAAGDVPVEGTPGEDAEANVYVNIVSQIAEGEDHVQGWSLSVRFEGDGLELRGATTEGTPGRDLQAGGFEKTELIDPDKNDGKEGAVSAVVLSFTMPITLPDGTNSVLCLSTGGIVPEDDMPAGSGAATGVFSFEDGLVGSGQPVNNVLTVGGGSQAAGNIDSASATVELVPLPLLPFTRGNANTDAKYDIADPIWTINFLFREGPPPPCMDAADANNDAMVDSSDAVFSINYQFLAGPAPDAPFDECGVDPEDLEGDGDGLGCDSATANCQ